MSYIVKVLFNKYSFFKYDTSINDVLNDFPLKEKRGSLDYPKFDLPYIIYIDLNNTEFDTLIEYFKISAYKPLIYEIRIKFVLTY